MKTEHLEVTDDLKEMALNFLIEIENNQESFTFPVVGDFIIDRYKWCKVERKNLEHDSLIYDIVDSSCYFGGASNVANIIGTFSKSSVNKNVRFFLGCGKSDHSMLKEAKLFDPETFEIRYYVDQKYDRVIPLKTRFIGKNRNEYLCRADKEPTKSEFPSISFDVAGHIAQDVRQLGCQSLFISDYNKGFISDDLLDSLFDVGGYSHRHTYCNIRPKRLKRYVDRMYFLSFNKTEFIQTYEILFDEVLDFISVDNIKRLKDELRVYNIIITFGGNGFIYCGDSECCIRVDPIRNLSTNSKNIIGAGDMVSAAFAFFNSMNFHFSLANVPKSVILYLVNCCAFLKVYTGEYTVSFDLLKSYINGKLLLF